MPVTLESRSRRMQVFHLPHEVCCRDRCACADAVAFVVAENPRTGERARKRVIRRVPGSLTFLARERKENLPAALLELAQVKAAIGRGYLRIVAQAADGSVTPEIATAAPGHTARAASGEPAQPAAAASPSIEAAPATGAAPALASPAATPSPTPAASTPASNSPTLPPAPPPAAKPPGKEA